MRIAVWYNLGGGGAKRALHQHVDGLVRAGHDVEVWCPSTARTDFLPLADICPEHVDPVDLGAFDRAAGARGRLDDLARPGRGLVELDRHYRRCGKAIDAGRFDVLFANTCQFNAVPSIAAHTRLPAVLYLQEPRRVSYEAHPVLPWVGLPGFDEEPPSWSRRVRELAALRAARTLARAEVTAAKRYHRILVNSLFSRESVARAYGLDAHVCYLGVDASLFSPAVRAGPSSAGHLLGVGQVLRHKRLDLVVEALGLLVEDRPPLVWVGDRSDPEYEREVTELARRRGVAFDLRIDVDDRDLGRLMAGARALVHAARLEPFGYTPLEAAAAGVPAVVVAEGGMRETVRDGDTGWVAEPTAPALAAAIASCLADPEEAARRSSRARAEALSRWSVAAAIGRLEQHLAAVATAAPVASGR